MVPPPRWARHDRGVSATASPDPAGDVAVDPERLGDGDDDAPRAPGRPRSPEADEAILAAAVELLGERGYERTSMEEVARRAGVSKATVYRRWPGKPQLVTDVLRAVVDIVDVPDTGDTRGDLLAIATANSHALGDTPLGRIANGLSGQFARDPELAADFRQRFVAPRRAMVTQVLRRGIERGDLRDDLDLELVLDMLTGTLYYRAHVSGGAVDAGSIERLVSHLLDGLAPR